MNRWVIADLHFYHTNIIKYENRPFENTEAMNEALIRNWNNIVKKDDLIYVLGDFTLSRRLDVIKSLCDRLNGRKVLVMGNHDTRKPADYIACGFISAIRKPILVEPNVVLSHEPPQAEYIFNGLKYIYGHVHSKPCEADKFDNCICVSAERTKYMPINLDNIIKALNQINVGCIAPQ